MLSKLFPSIHATLKHMEDVAPYENAPSFWSLFHGETAFVVHLGF